VPWATIIETARNEQVDIIGLSGLITPSLDEMVTVAEEMQRAQLDIPLLIGGATTSRLHTALRIDPAFDGPVIHVLDASRAVGVASRLLSDTQKDQLVSDTADEYQVMRDKRAGKQPSKLLPLDEARANAFVPDLSQKPPAPAQPGLHVFEDWDLADLAEVFDWTPFFRSWELAGTYPAILDDEIVGESARALKADADAMLEQIISEKWLTAKGVCGFWPCRREGDDVVITPSTLQGRGRSPEGAEGVGNDASDAARRPHPPAPSPEGEREILLPMLRQQVSKSRAKDGSGRANYCLADFIDPAGDWIGGFGVGIHGIEPHLERFRADTDDYSDILLKALADRFAEAFAERLHQHVRTTLWGYAPDENLSNAQLIKEEYAGIRPAPGYPACPDHSLKPILFELLGARDNAGLELTESCAMLPTSAVSGMYFGHPQSSYFGVARIGRDQLEDYSGRRGMPLAEVERWLRPNLD